jgi:hypothetical protein
MPMPPVPAIPTKTYPKRGPLQQFRFDKASAFTCFRCGETKKSKLITVYQNDWSKCLCNGCYGRLLSLYDIKAGTAADDQRAEALAAAPISSVAAEQQREAERLFRASEGGRISCLAQRPDSQRQIAAQPALNVQGPQPCHCIPLPFTHLQRKQSCCWPSPRVAIQSMQFVPAQFRARTAHRRGSYQLKTSRQAAQQLHHHFVAH